MSSTQGWDDIHRERQRDVIECVEYATRLKVPTREMGLDPYCQPHYEPDFALVLAAVKALRGEQT